MNIIYQDLENAKRKIERIFTRNPHASPSATFRDLRSMVTVSFFGDYPILSTIFDIMNELGIQPTRFQINYCFNQSEELNNEPKKIKMELLNQLFDIRYVQLKTDNNSIKEDKN